MATTDVVLTAASAAGAICLAFGVLLWALAGRRRSMARIAALQGRIETFERQAETAQASAEAFDSALIRMEDGEAFLAAGDDSLAACAAALDVGAEPQSVINALMRGDPDHANRLRTLFERGEACAFEVRGPHGGVSVEGRAAGAQAWLKLSLAAGDEQGLPTATRFAAMLDGRETPAWIAAADGSPVWANRAWLAAVDAPNIAAAAAKGQSFDKEADVLAAESANLGERRNLVRWAPVAGRRRAFKFVAQPLDGGGAGVFADDVTDIEDTRETLKRHVEAHDETLNHIADAVAIFSQKRRLSFHNTAFAEIWGLEPAWLLERPTHGEILDRLRQRRRLPETADYAAWKAEELAHYEAVTPGPDDMWSLPDGRTLRVVRQPHPMGGLLILFSDITGELRLNAQFNSLVQVQQATLDKLNDAVSVFGADGRLRLHNEAFTSFWRIDPDQIAVNANFEDVVELCLPRLHDRQFWKDMKGRVADPDPRARAPMTGEVKTSDDRIVAWQSRPLPDGATLIAFDDVTATRRLESALDAREAALSESQRLKREFVGNVSYELRTPLTTIIGYSELLERAGDGMTERGRGYVASVRTAASQLARSIDDVLDMAAYDAGEMALEVEEVKVADLLTAAAARWTTPGAAQGVTLSVESGEAAGLIRCDVRRMGQTLDHLVENALRQTPAGGVITLAGRRAPGEVRLQVADTGRGIPFHVQAKIFDRFVGRDSGGPGLGLALVKALVELHGGWVALESEPGHGATFTCHLPEAVQTAGVQQRELGF
jgi:signal transduction histidine kinase